MLIKPNNNVNFKFVKIGDKYDRKTAKYNFNIRQEVERSTKERKTDTGAAFRTSEHICTTPFLYRMRKKTLDGRYRKYFVAIP
ncbi:hypothetical protein CE91St54_41440 [Hungatella hathewayi]|uniref:Uncharacterized protein n=1 Tax=Hungatella hathewayi TaxID=154046 RepID=A0AA37JKI1_9FIRM|nr:hypothetical protein CE91St55_48650 [Hungatella hathewayi]GKH09036.1 hypothetical protein CE91St54_41440 [Hungatella hathewayi]